MTKGDMKRSNKKLKFIIAFALMSHLFSMASARSFSERGGADRGEILIVVEAENDNPFNSIKTVRYRLPSEIMEKHIIDSAGLTLSGDFLQGGLFLETQKEFKPFEIKRFNVKVKDVWRIPPGAAEEYAREAEALNDLLKETENATIADALYQEIIRRADNIISRQKNITSVKEHIEAFRENEKALREIWVYMDRLREIAGGRSVARKKTDHKEKIEKILTVATSFAFIMAVVSFFLWSAHTHREKTAGRRA